MIIENYRDTCETETSDTRKPRQRWRSHPLLTFRWIPPKNPRDVAAELSLKRFIDRVVFGCDHMLSFLLAR